MKTNTVSKLLVGVLLVSVQASASVPKDQVPSVLLPNVVPGSSIQAVEDIPDQSKMTVIVNSALLDQKMNLPGWNASTQNRPNAEGIKKAFAVRTTANPAAPTATDSVFFAGRGVGRSGVWELSGHGQAFAWIDGRPLKGLTIKGYGGNAGKSQQPNGSLEAAEAYRDTVVSKILMEKGVDTYVGALTVVRPVLDANGNATTTAAQANYIRLSRSSLRLNDLMDRKGAELRATVEHLSNLVADEIGMKPSPQQFTQWLIQRSALTLAGKEQARVKASNTNKDNFGIAELVDFGEAKYDPIGYVPGADLKSTGAWSKGLSEHVIEAGQNIAQEFGFTIDAASLFNKTYAEHFDALEQKEKSRLVLDKATESDLKAIGVSDISARKIIEYREQKPFGILTTRELMNSVQMPDADRAIVWNHTTTDIMKLQNGLSLPNAIVDEVGGAKGLRYILANVSSQAASDVATATKLAEIAINDRMTEIGTNKYKPQFNSGYGAQTVELLRAAAGQYVAAHSAHAAHAISGMCAYIFAP